MESFRFFLALLVIAIAAVLTQSLGNREWNSLSRRKRRVAQKNSTCSTHLLHSPSGAILKSSHGDNDTFNAGEKVDFVCKDDYRQIGELQSFICQDDETWKKYSKRQTGFCVVKRCNVKTFSCKNGAKIDACKQCDCVKDCSDASDEVSCAPALVDVTGEATGTLRASSRNRKPNEGLVTCSSWKLQTNDQDFYIKLLFKTFSMSPNCMKNYVLLENANFTAPTRTALGCCENSDRDVCKFGGKTSPPLSRTRTNWMTVRFFSETNESYFEAVWYNVNRLFPSGAIPSQDSTYAPKIKLPRRKNYAVPKSTVPILAFVLFSLILFVVGSVIACKLGKRFLGPSCSFRHFFAWVLRRPIPPDARLALHAAEQRALTEDTDNSFSGESSHRRTPGRLQATYLGDDSDDSRDGSTENII